MQVLALFAITALTCGAVVTAAPPPGYPSVEQAEQMLKLPQQEGVLPNAGEVIAAYDSNNYTYVQLTYRGTKRWLAVPQTSLAPGTWIRYGEGRLFRDWYSRKLKRSFDAVLFVGEIQVLQ